MVSKKFLLLFFSLFILEMSFHINIMFPFAGLDTSSNIWESKFRKALVKEYKVKYIEFNKDVPKNVKNLIYPIVNNTTCWVEKKWLVDDSFPLLRRQMFTGDTLFVIKNIENINIRGYIQYAIADSPTGTKGSGRIRYHYGYNSYYQDNISLDFSYHNYDHNDLEDKTGIIHLEKVD